MNPSLESFFDEFTPSTLLDRKDHHVKMGRLPRTLSGGTAENDPVFTIGGEVAEGYEEVQYIFEQHFRDGCEDRAQVCAYVGGRKVVDLWGVTESGGACIKGTDCIANSEGNLCQNTKNCYGPDWMQNVFSSSKSLTSLVVAMLVDRGCMSYDQKISEIWPEFVFGGDLSHPDAAVKAEITIACLMRHEGGFPRLTSSKSFRGKMLQPLKLSDLTAERIRAGAVSPIIEQMSPLYTPGSRREYHAWSRGWVVNEIVRRADQQGRTIGQFLRDEVARPLGVSDELCVGTPERLWGKIAPLSHYPLWWYWKQMLLPRSLGGSKVPTSSVFLRMLVLGSIPALAVAKLTADATGFTAGSYIPELETEELDTSTAADETTGPKTESADADEAQALLNMEADGGRSEKLKEEGAAVFTRVHSGAWRRAEMPSINAHASARAMAKVASAIVESLPQGSPRRSAHNTAAMRPASAASSASSASSASPGGDADAADAVAAAAAAAAAASDHVAGFDTPVKPLLSSLGASLAHSGVVPKKIAFGPQPVVGLLDSHFGNAGWNDFKDTRVGFVGWMGAGGSVMQWNRELRIGFGYAMNLMEITPTCERARAMQVAVVKCAKAQKQKAAAATTKQQQ